MAVSKGIIYYVVGASGSGKDSLIDYARLHINYSSCPVLFMHRYITRKASEESENYISLSRKEFDFRQQAGLFSMHWSSHGYSYGIGIEMDAWINKGIPVVVNGSREYLSLAMQKYPDLNVILVQVNRDILKQRLIERGRESREEIEERLQKADAYELPVAKEKVKQVNNDGELEQAGKIFLQIITA